MTKSHDRKSLLIVAFLAAAVFVLRASPMIFNPTTGNVDPHVVLGDNKASLIVERQRQQQVGAFLAVNEGEVSRTEERFREATALAVAASLFAANESLNRRIPPTANAVLFGVANAGLMPPGMEYLQQTGEVRSLDGKLFLRYRPEPLGVEIVSLGNAPIDGPALLVRVPAGDVDGRNKDDARLFVATTLEQVKLPAPFAVEAEVLAMGFSPEPLRAAKLPNP